MGTLSRLISCIWALIVLGFVGLADREGALPTSMRGGASSLTSILHAERNTQPDGKPHSVRMEVPRTLTDRATARMWKYSQGYTIVIQYVTIKVKFVGFTEDGAVVLVQGPGYQVIVITPDRFCQDDNDWLDDFRAFWTHRSLSWSAQKMHGSATRRFFTRLGKPCGSASSWRHIPALPISTTTPSWPP